MLNKLEITGGRDRAGHPEAVARLCLRPGDSLAVIGPTGSGKSELLADIEQLAEGDTPSGRRVILNDGHKAANVPRRPAVATLSQRTNFILDASVAEFVRLHAGSLGKEQERLAEKTVTLANTLCGEPFAVGSPLQRLSGGQARALMIADIALISDAPVVLIDEVENAGIDKRLALNALAGQGKISVISTHDPVLILSCPRRLVMASGGMNHLLDLSPEEKICRSSLERMDDALLRARTTLRGGGRLAPEPD
ncbi:MAG: ATP-binding cassette domain-containing protein [Deltaproteobacteria bacterium]|jgi:ABC-type lipoprotein export system ATPase subunit|nr:ATP-binding cassette domain-containing protein [Deltaproteobacteria bacterium]